MKTLKNITTTGHKAVIRKQKKRASVRIYLPDSDFAKPGSDPAIAFARGRTIGRAFRTLGKKVGSFKYGRFRK